MAKKIKLTRPELKRYRDALERFQRYLPMLKLKQQQLQIKMREVSKQIRELERRKDEAIEKFRQYESVLGDIAGIDVKEISKPVEVKTSTKNVAGVNIPVFEDIVFASPNYSLFGTPAWVDNAISDLREINRYQVQYDIIKQEYDLLDRELTRVIQRVNLFEKIKIPEAQEAIRIIRIKLGDEMTAAVGRSKIAKAKLSAGSKVPPGLSAASDDNFVDVGLEDLGEEESE